MAGLRCAVGFESIQLVTTADKTVVQVKAPANQRLKIIGWRIGFTGLVTTNKPVRIKGFQQTSAGTGGSSSAPVKLEQSLNETPQATGQTGPASSAWTAEPTAGVVMYRNRCHPQGSHNETFYFGCEIWVKGGDYFGLVLNADDANVVDGELYYEE